jgi:hypothetical protein
MWCVRFVRVCYGSEKHTPNRLPTDRLQPNQTNQPIPTARHALKDLDIEGYRVPKDSLLLINWHVSSCKLATTLLLRRCVWGDGSWLVSVCTVEPPPNPVVNNLKTNSLCLPTHSVLYS